MCEYPCPSFTPASNCVWPSSPFRPELQFQFLSTCTTCWAGAVGPEMMKSPLPGFFFFFSVWAYHTTRPCHWEGEEARVRAC